MTRCAERAARRANVRYFQPVRLEKSSGKTSKARSWIVTTPMQGRASGRKQLGAWTRSACSRRSSRGSSICSKSTSGPRPLPSLMIRYSMPGPLGQRVDELAHVAPPAPQLRVEGVAGIDGDDRHARNDVTPGPRAQAPDRVVRTHVGGRSD